MKKHLLITLVAIFVIFANSAAFSDTLTREAEKVSMHISAKFEQPNPATQTNQSGVPCYQKVFNMEDINLVDGSVNFTQTDLKIPGRGGLDLVVTRTYNSGNFSCPIGLMSGSMKQRMDLVDSQMKPSDIINTEKTSPESDYFYSFAGRGWEFGFTARLLAITYTCQENKVRLPSDQILVQINGSSMRFEKKDGIFKPVDQGIYYIVKNTKDGYALFDTNGTKYLFKDCYFEKNFSIVGDVPNQHMKARYLLLSRIEDRNGNFITLRNESYGDKKAGEVQEKKKGTYYPTLEDIQINPGFIAKEVPLTLIDIGLALINPVNWVIGTILYNFDKFTPKEYVYYEVAGYNHTPLRPVEITDTCDRIFKLKYNDNEQISRVEYLDSDNRQVSIVYSYDNDNLIKVDMPDGDPIRFEYASFNRNLENGFDDKGFLLTKMTYPSGAQIKYEYNWFSPNTSDLKDKKDFSFYLISRKTVNEDIWTYNYSGGFIYNRHCGKPGDGRSWTFEEAKVIDPLGSSHTYVLVNDLLSKITDPAGNTIDYHWDLDKKVKVETINKEGPRTCKQYYEYDGYGNCTEIIDLGDSSLWEDDRTMRFEYSSKDTLKDKNILNRVSHSYIEDWKNRYKETYYDHDDKGNLVLAKKCLGDKEALYEYSYDNFGNMVEEIDPMGNSTDHEFSGSYRNAYLTRTARGGLSTCRTYYFNSGLVRSTSDNNSQMTGYTYDSMGRITGKTNPDGTRVTYGYLDDANKITIQNEMDMLTTYDFDTLGRLVRIEHPDNSEVNYSYNSLSMLTAKADQLDRKTEYKYDPSGRLNKVIYPDGSIKQFKFDGSRITIADELNRQWAYFIDGRDNIIKVIEPNGKSTRYDLDPLHNLTKTINQKYQTTNYRYDNFGNILEITRPDDSKYLYEYDLLGRVIARIDANKRRTEYKYDGLNRITNILYQEPEYNIEYSFDLDSTGFGKGMLCKVKDKTGGMEFEYDRMGRTISQRKSIEDIYYETDYSYDRSGNIKEIRYPNNYRVTYIYDEVNMLSEVILSTSLGQKTIARFEYFPTKTIKKIEYMNGLCQNFEYDAKDRVKRIAVNDDQERSLLDHSYQYDAAGNLIAFKFSPKESLRYEYDDLDRLTRVKYPSEDDSFYSYDATGNRTGLKFAYGEVIYAYNGVSDRLESYRTAGIETKLSYDGCGNQVERSNFADLLKLTYDGENRPIGTSNTNHNLNHHLVFSYDFKGQLALKTDKNNTEIYHYDLKGNLIAVTDLHGGTKASYIYANGSRICRIDADGKLFFYINDHLQSPILIADEQGNVLNRYLFDPFGSIFAAREEEQEKFRFIGKEYLEMFDLYHFGARLYDPLMGRFISEDKVEPDYLNPQSLNRYVYCLNNPFKFIDIDALETYMVHGIWAGNLQDIYALKDTLLKKGIPDIYVFEWSKRGFWDTVGNLGEAAGEIFGVNNSAASRLADFIATHHKQGEPINIVCHSAGGSISINAAGILEDKYKLKVNRLFLMAAPIGALQIKNVDKAFNMLSLSNDIKSLNNSPMLDITFTTMSIGSYMLNYNGMQHVYFNDIGHSGWFSSLDVEKFLGDNILR